MADSIDVILETRQSVPSGSIFEEIVRLRRDGHEGEALKAALWQRYGERVAAIIIDSKGFSRTSKKCGIVHSLSNIALVQEILRGCFDQTHARRFQFLADNAYGFFACAADALDCARAAMDAVQEAKVPLADGEYYEISIGIGYGDMLACPLGGYYGVQMNLASKLGEDIAGPSELLMTGEAHSQLPSTMRDGFEKLHMDISGNPSTVFRDRQFAQ